MSDVILLRKLTEKSILKFGKFAEVPIYNLMEMEKGYLQWVYFNSSNITFTDEILDALYIPLDMRIPKPGKNVELWKQYQTAKFANINTFDKKAIEHRANKKARQKLGMVKNIVGKLNSKSQLAAKNRGH